MVLWLEEPSSDNQSTEKENGPGRAPTTWKGRNSLGVKSKQ